MQELGREPSPEEVAAVLGIDPAKAREIRAATAAIVLVLSFNLGTLYTERLLAISTIIHYIIL